MLGKPFWVPCGLALRNHHVGFNGFTPAPIEREDLRFVHELDNNESVMHYWFEEPYEAFFELSELYDKHIHDQSERRFIAECDDAPVGFVELVDINHIHRRAEFQIIIAPGFQGQGFAKAATRLAVEYAFMILNLHKVYLVVDVDNTAAVHVYKQIGFKQEGLLVKEYFSASEYHDVIRMAIFQHEFLARPSASEQQTTHAVSRL